MSACGRVNTLSYALRTIAAFSGCTSKNLLDVSIELALDTGIMRDLLSRMTVLKERVQQVRYLMVLPALPVHAVTTLLIHAVGLGFFHIAAMCNVIDALWRVRNYCNAGTLPICPCSSFGRL